MADRPLGSRYLLKEQIGRGATGTVWRGVVRDTGEQVAIKILREDLAAEPDVVARFVQERSVLLRLRHKNLVRVRDLVTEGDVLGLVMDLIEGSDLREHLRSRSTLPPAEATGLLAEVADALAVAHQAGVVHRDLKPDNVLLERGRDGVLRVRLTDFGVARVLDHPGITTVAVVVGTPNYLAPELASSDTPTPAVDVYALGIVLYELVVGRTPYAGGHPVTILRRHMDAMPRRRAGIPDPLWSLIEACLHRDPAMRPKAVELAARLRVVTDEILGVPALEPLPRNADLLATCIPSGAAGEDSAAEDPVGDAVRVFRSRAELPPPGTPSSPRQPTSRPKGLGGRRVMAGAVAFASVVAMIVLAPLLTGHGPFAQGSGQKTDVVSPVALPSPTTPATSSATPAPAAVGTAAVLTPTPTPSATSSRRAKTFGPARAVSENDRTNKPTRSTPRPTLKPTPPPPPLSWICAPQTIWTAGEGVGVRPCYATRGAVVYVKGQVTADAGKKVDVTLTLQNVDSGASAGGPFRCEFTFSQVGSSRTCGQFSTRPTRGHRYVVVESWWYSGTSGAPRGTGRGPVFGW